MGTYNFKVVPEANWYALGVALGAVAGAIMTALSVDPYVSTPIVAAIVGLPRAIIGVLLPPPPTTGGSADKSV